MKNLIVCCDGTWNTPDQEDDGVPVPTNVVRFFNAVADRDSSGNAQLKYYHSGVGVEGKWWEKIAGGTMGLGLSRNIMGAYKWLGCNYQSGDRIYLIGFSRGAYTVRSLSGMIARCGLPELATFPEETLWDKIGDIYKKYQSDDDSPDAALTYFDDQTPGNGKVFFLGVWDTVGALGIPDDLALLNLFDNPKHYQFHDLALSEGVTHARHAVAIDEMRASFTPTLWDTQNIAPDRDIKQIWFPGVHCDVGGGYPEKGLSDGALKWMIDEAVDQGLKFEESMRRQVVPGAQDVLHDSCTGNFKLLRTQPRSVPRIADDNNLLIHRSAVSRQSEPPIAQAPYRGTRVPVTGCPISVEIYAREHWNYTGIYLEQGQRYRFKASGQWVDKTVQCGPGGSDDGKFQPAELIQIAGSLWGKIEGAYKKIVNNQNADFIGTKREESMPWFALVGVVANSGNPGSDGTPPSHETFLIGEEYNLNGCKEFSPQKSGYLYGFANDAWHFYDNNHGCVILEVTKV